MTQNTRQWDEHNPRYHPISEKFSPHLKSLVAANGLLSFSQAAPMLKFITKSAETLTANAFLSETVVLITTYTSSTLILVL